MKGRFIAALAGSAGSHARLVEFFDHTPHDDVSYVILQHLPATWRSQLSDILARHTNLSIRDIRQGMVLHNDSIYVAASGQYVTIRDNIFTLSERTVGINETADIFMRSLAANSGHRAIGIVLEGMLNDGTQGLRAIHQAGGFTLTQDPSTCRFCDMPVNAIRAGIVDKVAVIKDMPGIIHQYVDEVLSHTISSPPTPQPCPHPPEIPPSHWHPG